MGVVRVILVVVDFLRFSDAFPGILDVAVNFGKSVGVILVSFLSVTVGNVSENPFAET